MKTILVIKYQMENKATYEIIEIIFFLCLCKTMPMKNVGSNNIKTLIVVVLG